MPSDTVNLVGSERQVSWAMAIRRGALATVPDEHKPLLCRVSDASWWIANRETVGRGIFKAPASEQLDGKAVQAPHAHTTARRQGTASAALEDMLGWSSSVSGDPRTAEAAVCALLSRFTKDGVTSMELARRSRQLLASVEKDLDAVKRILEELPTLDEHESEPAPQLS